MSAWCSECGCARWKASSLAGFKACEECGKLAIGEAPVTPEPEPEPKVELPLVVERHALGIDCPECGYDMELRSSGLYVCDHCGLVRVGKDKEPEPQPVTDEEQSVSTDDAPDMIDPVIGWRVWRVKTKLRPGELPLLRSATFGGAIWEPGRTVAAVCPKGHKHGPPCTGACGSGLYSAKDYWHLMGMSYPEYEDADEEVMVLGECYFWGKVVEGTQGWRAEFGYPKRLWVPYEANRLAKPLREAYGVPVGMKNFLADTLWMREVDE